jgi:16S rRNA U516 pseudouridylate synthase RsuA-like enzyme
MSVEPEKDKIELLEKALKIQENLIYYKVNKPRGIVTTCAQNDERSILDIVDIKERIFPI